MPNSAFCSAGVKTVAATLRPAQRHLHGTFGVIPVRRVWRTFVEDHHDVRAEIVLNLHRLFRIEENRIAVDRVTEVDALLGDLANITRLKTGNRQNRSDRAFPLHEVMQIAVKLHDLLTGRSHRWKVLPRIIWAPVASTSSGVIPFTVP